jgi:hypothetical protein
MDIYPTYSSLLGVDEYHWKGFGINLLSDTTANDPRRLIQEEEAFVLSDKLIRNNYFAR